MDVYCAGMYRACSTWQYEVIACLLQRYRKCEALGYLLGAEYASLIRSQPPRLDSWRVLKSHEEHPAFTRTLRSHSAYVVYAHRDVRDVAYSLMHKRGLSFEQLLDQGMVHQVLANDAYWRTRPRVVSQRYDDLIARPADGVKELARFLKIELDGQEAEEIARAYSLENNRKRVDDLRRKLEGMGVNLDDPANFQRYDRETLLHWNHLRDGRPGTWREMATSTHREILRRVCGSWLIEMGYETDERWATELGPCDGGEIEIRRAIARGERVCRTRCLALRHPRIARVVKSMLFIQDVPPPARSVDPPACHQPLPRTPAGPSSHSLLQSR